MDTPDIFFLLLLNILRKSNEPFLRNRVYKEWEQNSYPTFDPNELLKTAPMA